MWESLESAKKYLREKDSSVLIIWGEGDISVPLCVFACVYLPLSNNRGVTVSKSLEADWQIWLRIPDTEHPCIQMYMHRTLLETLASALYMDICVCRGSVVYTQLSKLWGRICSYTSPCHPFTEQFAAWRGLCFRYEWSHSFVVELERVQYLKKQ